MAVLEQSIDWLASGLLEQTKTQWKFQKVQMLAGNNEIEALDVGRARHAPASLERLHVDHLQRLEALKAVAVFELHQLRRPLRLQIKAMAPESGASPKQLVLNSRGRDAKIMAEGSSTAPLPLRPRDMPPRPRPRLFGGIVNKCPVHHKDANLLQ